MSYRDWIREGEAELAAMPQPTPEEDQALALELARENGEGAGGVVCECEWCGEEIPDGESGFSAYCSVDCEQAATSETYASLHPRPEEAG